MFVITAMFEKVKQFISLRPRFKKTVGWVLVVVGGIAFVVPLVPGFPLLIIGAQLVGLQLLSERLNKTQPATVTVPVLAEKSE